MPLELISVESKRRPADADTSQAAAAAVAAEDPGKEKCPRCESRNTKFCYYNNYNTSQPRHFCRSCRRYWTLGGSLRNVPIGGSSRNGFGGGPNKRFRTASYPDHASTPSPVGHVSPILHPPSLTGGVPSAGFHLGEAFRFELGLGMGMGPAGMMWHPEDAWRMETGGGDYFALSAVPVSVSSPAGGVTGGSDVGR